MRLSGNKLEGKLYHRHSGYPGGLRTMNYERMLSERPTLVIEKAIKGMLPKNRLGRQMFGKLNVYAGAEHPHQAQQPVPLGLGEVPPWKGLPVPPEPAAPADAAERPAKARRAPAAAKDESGTKRPARASKPKAETTGTGTRRAPAAGRAKKETASASAGRSTRSRTSGEAKPATRSRAKPKKDEKES